MVKAALEAGGLLEFIDDVLSVDDRKIHKHDPRVSRGSIGRMWYVSTNLRSHIANIGRFAS